ncbi:unnamed protein product [Albugo candida]|uniref:Uncharacterized protein n=1 Tax=Albugo candida TaxID=65357 RepID=A0A024G4A0_9STRA|nr:unnamed protein product [Albugo candida]|eukprot:CCI41367.1 unnamed protein product [Albugo candida]
MGQPLWKLQLFSSVTLLWRAMQPHNDGKSWHPLDAIAENNERIRNAFQVSLVLSVC